MISALILKLNDEKTEFMLFGSHQQLSKISIDCIHIGDSSIVSASQLGIWVLFLILP